MDIDKAVHKAAQKLGYPRLQPNQERAVKAFLNEQDVFVCEAGNPFVTAFCPPCTI